MRFFVEVVRSLSIRGQADVNNSGNILVTATGGGLPRAVRPGGAFAGVISDAEAFGLYALNIDNVGDITVLATAGEAYASGGTTSAIADAFGIYGMGGTTTNARDITVTAVGGIVSGETGQADARAYGIYTWGNVVNSGNITATATAQDGFASEACGIYMGSEGDNTEDSRSSPAALAAQPAGSPGSHGTASPVSAAVTPP